MARSFGGLREHTTALTVLMVGAGASLGLFVALLAHARDREWSAFSAEAAPVVANLRSAFELPLEVLAATANCVQPSMSGRRRAPGRAAPRVLAKRNAPIESDASCAPRVMYPGWSMHKSRLCSVVIDCENADLAVAAQFWAQALGRPTKSEQGSYVTLEDRAGQPLVEVQRVSHPSRVHLDIETDDIEAEVQRLEALGARRVEHIQTWWVMEAPTGQRFCVIRVQRGVIGADANVWP